jgi:hypothetical protein
MTIAARHLLLLCLYFVAIVTGYSQNTYYTTKRIEIKPPEIDGRLNDTVWTKVEWGNNFTQRQPHDGKPPTFQTEFKIVYDNNNIYVGIRAFDDDPTSIIKRLTRRDESDGDFVEITFDSYSDKLTGFQFTVNAAGVKSDAILTNDNSGDLTWDPIWYVKTAIDSLGWTAEMKIPLNQLRFSAKPEQIWGLQVLRLLYDKQEVSLWKYIPKEASGWVSMFGELKGIKDLVPKKEIEIIPYTVVKVDRFKKEEGNPFADGKDTKLSAGMDGKIGITNDFTLNYTINPDFGQVEADPSEVNLSVFESYFQEKRPFFIEGKNIFDFKPTNGDGPNSSDNLFYSRRIGRNPHYSPDLNENEYAKIPDQTNILGAFKLSGKTRNGLSAGLLETFTQKEVAKIDRENVRSKETVEPFTNYTAGSLQKDFNKGNTVIGAMLTATNRSITDTILNFLPTKAYTGGINFIQNWDNKAYTFRFNGLFSLVEGPEKAMLDLQESPTHYFQRPDRDNVHIDSSLRKLVGHGGTLEFAKNGKGHLRYIAWLTWRSPGLELNDMGYMRESDIVQQVFWAGYNIWEPFSIFRSMSFNFNQWSGYDFGGENIYKGGNTNININFKNFWYFGTGFNRDGQSLSVGDLWGGPALLYPGGWNWWSSVNTDYRKKLQLYANYSCYWGDKQSQSSSNYSGGFTYKPTNALSISVSPFYSEGKTKTQHVDNVEAGNDTRYIMASMLSKSFGASVRINLSLSPEISVQYYGQPFIFSGKYTEFKNITSARAIAEKDRFHLYTPAELSYNADDNVYSVDENSDGISEFSFDNPNFNFFQFRSNLVMRWEYLPGSSIYLVWSQGRTGDDQTGNFHFSRNMDDLFAVHPQNIFLVKVSFRISV